MFATGGEHTVEEQVRAALPRRGPTSLRETLDLGSPLYFANPFGGPGFWFDREHGQFVALDVRVPNSTTCNVKWIGRSTNTYVDCNGDHLKSEELARYPVEVGQRGEKKGSVFVDLKHLEPPPTESSASG